MPLRLYQFVPARQVAQDRQAGSGGDLRLAKVQMAGAADAVEDNAGQAQGRVKLLIAEDFGGHAAGHFAGVGNQNDRGVQQFRQLRRGAVFGQGIVAVVEAHHALDDGDFFRSDSAAEQFGHGGRRQQPGIQVAGGDAAGELMIGGVNVVGAGLKGLHGIAAAGQGGHNPGGDSGFAHAAAYPGDDNCGGHWRPPVLRMDCLLSIMQRVGG